jgi:hypothetical protein
MIKPFFFMIYLIAMVVGGAARISDKIQLWLGWPEWTSFPLVILFGLPLIYIAGPLGKSLRSDNAR